MTETLINLVPTYGAYLIFFVVFAACLAVPLPASLMVLTSGSFSASGDMSLTVVLAVTFAAYVLGGQAAFGLARTKGPALLDWAKKSPRMGPVIRRSEELLQRRGAMAVLLSHTVVSPTCPYVCYLCGAGGLSWRAFCLAAIPGALLWSVAYVMLGYTFASQLELVVENLSNFFGLILTGAVVVSCFIILRSRWRKMHETAA